MNESNSLLPAGLELSWEEMPQRRAYLLGEEEVIRDTSGLFIDIPVVRYSDQYGPPCINQMCAPSHLKRVRPRNPGRGLGGVSLFATIMGSLWSA